MKDKIIWIFILFSISSCVSEEKESEKSGICSKEQIERFEKCTKNYASFYDRTIREMSDNLPDSILNFYKDVRDLELPELIEKYKIEKYQINSFIQSICVSNEIENAYQKLNEKLKDNDSIRLKIQKLISNPDSMAIQKYNFDFSKIKPSTIKNLNIKKSKNGKYYYLEKEDTVFVNVTVAEY